MGCENIPAAGAALVQVPRSVDRPRGRELCGLLEAGKILYFPQAPYGLSQREVEVLLRQRQSDSRWHKNIAYRPLRDRVTGFDRHSPDARRLHIVLRSFSRRVTRCVAELLPDYARNWRHDYASFRPLQEKGRQLRLNARNDLLHVDSFPKRPTFGDRILRVFVNINPSEPRHWITGDPFDALAPELPGLLGAALHEAAEPPRWREVLGSGRRLARRAGLPIHLRSTYDDLMRLLHQRMKESHEFQTASRRDHSHFPPGSGWIVFTDSVPHAVLSGQHALEQTFIVSRSAMVSPEKTPATVLERLCKRPLTRAA